jgi:hypothetical protein
MPISHERESRIRLLATLFPTSLTGCSGISDGDAPTAQVMTKTSYLDGAVIFINAAFLVRTVAWPRGPFSHRFLSPLSHPICPNPQIMVQTCKSVPRAELRDWTNPEAPLATARGTDLTSYPRIRAICMPFGPRNNPLPFALAALVVYPFLVIPYLSPCSRAFGAFIRWKNARRLWSDPFDQRRRIENTNYQLE